MIPAKEKAEELVDKFKLSTGANTKINIYVAKQCALIAVDEILNYDNQFIQTEEQFNYWKEIKQQIIKL